MKTITQISNAQYLYGTKNFSKVKQNNCEPTNVQKQQSFKGKCSAKQFLTSWVEYIKSLWDGFPATQQIINKKSLKKARKINPDMTNKLYRNNVGYIDDTYTPRMIYYIVQENATNPESAECLKEIFKISIRGFDSSDIVDKFMSYYHSNPKELLECLDSTKRLGYYKLKDYYNLEKAVALMEAKLKV